MPEPTYALTVMRPFMELAAARARDLEGAVASLSRSAVDDGRIPARRARAWLLELQRATGDADLGLHAALRSQLGDFGVLELLGTSAQTRRAAMEAVCRYGRLLNDGADYQLRLCAPKVHLVLGSIAPCNRVLSDFQLAAYHLASRRRTSDVLPELEVWLRHPAPADTRAYRSVFGDARLVFDADFDGFVLDAHRLDETVPTRNPVLHQLLCDYADRLLEDIAPLDDLLGRVTTDIRRTLRWGDHSASRTASRLGMSRRTLTRRLTQRGTTFSTLLRDVRHHAAVRYLRDTDYSVEDIALLLGYAECSSFIRAFGSWTGCPPLRYRARQRTGASRNEPDNE